jgi:toxin ParE1/3/4
MRVEWSVDALSDLRAITTRISQDNPKAAARFSETIFAGVERLALFPSIGREGRVIGTREWIITKGPYVIPYRVRNGHLQVLAIFHTRRSAPCQR